MLRYRTGEEFGGPDVQIVESALLLEPSEHLQTVLRVCLDALPVPDGTCAWQDIIDFKKELYDKQWRFRRFLQALATEEQSEAEIRDHIEWTTSEYTKAMKRRGMAIASSAITAFMLPTVDIAVNPEGSHIASLVGCGLAINKLRLELLEGEAKAPGRECAYLDEVRKKFGGS